MRGLILVAHGSRREESNTEFEGMVFALKKRLGSSYAKVEASFLEFAQPDIAGIIYAMIQAGITQIQIYPFFLNSGKHVHHDIPEKIREAQGIYPEVTFELLAHFGSSEHILSVITNDLQG